MDVKITEIKETKKHRYALFLDGEFSFSVDEETLFEFHLHENSCVSEEILEEIRHKSDYRYGREKALSLLSFKDYTKKELIKKLLSVCQEETATLVAEKMEELSLINDESYAERYARDLFNIKKLSVSAIERELYKKGLDSEIVSVAVSQFEDADTEKLLSEFILRKYERKLEDEKGIKSLTGILLRKGYSYGEIKSVISNLLENRDYYNY